MLDTARENKDVSLATFSYELYVDTERCLEDLQGVIDNWKG